METIPETGRHRRGRRFTSVLSQLIYDALCKCIACHYIHKVIKDVRSCVSLSDQDFSIENSENLEIFICDINLKIFRYMRAEC